MMLMTALHDVLEATAVKIAERAKTYADQTTGLMGKQVPSCSPSHWFLHWSLANELGMNA